MTIDDMIVIRASARRIIDTCDSRFNKRDILAEASAILKLINNEIEKDCRDWLYRQR